MTLAWEGNKCSWAHQVILSFGGAIVHNCQESKGRFEVHKLGLVLVSKFRKVKMEACSPEPEPPDLQECIHLWSFKPPLGWWDDIPITWRTSAMKDMEVLKYWQGKEGQEKIRVMVANGSKLPQVTVWCLRCDKMWMRDMEVIEVTEDKEQTRIQVKKKKKNTIKKAQKAKEGEQDEITPHSSPSKRTKVTKSPGAKAKEMARLLKYHQHLSDEYGMPVSDIQQRLRQEADQEDEEQLGLVKDLRGEFERMGAEALLPPLSTFPAKV